MTILVLGGGDSPEREVSLRSAKAVKEALRNNGHKVIEYDPRHGYHGLDDFRGTVDVVLPILHGINGEDGVLQKELEKRGFKFLGADSKVSKICFDKVATKAKITELGFKTPKHEIVGQKGYQNSSIKSKPHVLKPIEGGSTIDSYIINDKSDAVDLGIFDKYPKMLLEELIEGNEITVPILGDKTLPVIEIIPPEGKDFDYENKYNGQTQELCPPMHVSPSLQLEAQKIAESLHRAIGVRHLSRTDIIIDKNSQLQVLEINTMPGMTNQSLFPKSAAVAGIDMLSLVERFVDMTFA